MKKILQNTIAFSVMVGLAFSYAVIPVFAQTTPHGDVLQSHSQEKPDSSNKSKDKDKEDKKEDKKSLSEDTDHVEFNRLSPLPYDESSHIMPSDDSFSISASALITAQVTTLGPNLIPNGSLESGASSTPTGWNKDRWLINSGSFNYPVTGLNGSNAIQIVTDSYTSGDAKWYFNDVAITGGKTYQLSDYSKSNIESVVTVRYKHSDGSFSYKYLASISSSTDFKQNVFQIVAPQNAVSLTVFHVIQQVGTLTTDEYSLNEVTTTEEPSNNLISNPDFEIADTNGNPQGWNKDRWLNNTGVFTYPAIGINNSKAAEVSINSYTSGDAKWYFNPVNVTEGTYTYSNQYKSTTGSNVTVQFQHQNGTFSYRGLINLPQANNFTPFSVDFNVDSTVSKVTIFHTISSVGVLTIDATSLILKDSGTPGGIFSTGAVTFSFDDGWASQYHNVLPKLNSAGLKGTFYIISTRFFENGFVGYLSRPQLQEIFNSGHEIGAHTRTHPHLPQLSPAQQQAEIAGSRQDLIAMNLGPISSFAYPFGEYTNETIQIVKNAGFQSARSTISGYAVPTSDKYQLERQSIEVTTSVDQIKSWVDAAIANKQWLILSLHRVDTSGDRYSITPTNFNQVVDYVKSKNVPVVTITQGINSAQ